MLLDECLDSLDRVVGMDQFVVVCVREEVGEQFLHIARSFNAQHLEDRVDLHQVLLVRWQRLEQFLNLTLDQKARLIAQQLKHMLDIFVVHLPARDRPAVTLALPRRLRCPLARGATLSTRLEYVLRRRKPAEPQLLLVNDFIRLQHLSHKVGHSLFVHLPYVAIPLGVSHLEVLEFALQIFKLFSDTLVLVCEVRILLLEPLLLTSIFLFEGAEHVGHPRELLLLRFDRVRVLGISLHEHPVVVVELLLVELIRGAHLL
mmetsp:Transcript_46030/g.103709  ORF Transcript_46030/g.103709 Transcript_46030/m.103709 type:complete len:260 (-) Transcript_46030:83-862(-)